MNVQDELPQESDLYKAARYYSQWWHVIPLKPRSKEAAILWRHGPINYQETAPDASELYEWFQEWKVQKPGKRPGEMISVRYDEPLNMAAILGRIVQSDFDGKSRDGGYEAWARQYPDLRELPRIRTGKGRYHVLFTTEEPYTYDDLPHDNGKIQVRTGRNVIVLPPSIHPETDKPYEWEVPIPPSGFPVIDPTTIGFKPRPHIHLVTRDFYEGDQLSTAEAEVIVSAVLPQWHEPNRHTLSLAVPGWLASIGVPEEDAKTVISTIFEQASQREGRDEWEEYQRSVRDTYVKAVRGDVIRGWSDLRDTLDPDELRQLELIARAHEPVFSLNAKVKGIVIPWQIDLADFLSIDFPPDAWLVDGLIADIQLGMIAGEPGSSKSWIALYLALCVALGEPLFGTYYIPERRRVVYVQEENSASKLNRRVARLLQWMGRDKEDIRGWFTLITNQSFRIDKPEVMERLATEVLTPQRPGLVIFDPMVEMHWKKENDTDEMAPLMAALRQIRDHYECVVLLIHHVTKATEIENFLYRVRGSSAITGALDFCIGVIRPDQRAEKSTVFWAKVRDDKKPHPFVVELIDNPDGSIRFAMYEGGENEKPKSDKAFPYTEDQVVAAFAEYGQTTIQRMMETFDEVTPDDVVTTSSAYKAAAAMVARLVNKGRLEKVTYSTLPGERGKIFRAI